MTSEKLRQALNAQPFQPFQIYLADGRRLKVPHPELLALSPSGRTMILYQPDDSHDVIDLLLVTRLHVGSNGKARRKPGTQRH